MSQFLTPDFLQLFVPLIGAVIAWFLNELRKQKADLYQRKEAKYIELLSALKGFYVSAIVNEAEAVDQKRKFLNQIDQCWLYCPDDVIRKGYVFLATIHTDRKSSEEEKQEALGEFVSSIRNDLFSHGFINKTRLKGTDFKVYYVT
jgi:hypothetical protein